MSVLKELAFWDEYLEKTIIIKSAIEAADLEIVNNMLDERAMLIEKWEHSGQKFHFEAYQLQIEKIKLLEVENDKSLALLRKKLETSSAENKKKLTQAERGKSVVGKYHSPFDNYGGNNIDQKR